MHGKEFPARRDLKGEVGMGDARTADNLNVVLFNLFFSQGQIGYERNFKLFFNRLCVPSIKDEPQTRIRSLDLRVYPIAFFVIFLFFVVTVRSIISTRSVFTGANRRSDAGADGKSPALRPFPR